MNIKQIKSLLKKKLNCKIETMAHPCGKFNSNTLTILKKLNIKIGFGVKINNNKNIYNFSRLDCAYI